MEIKSTILSIKKLVQRGLIVLFILLFSSNYGFTQELKYNVRDGKMFIEISREVGEASLDSFIHQFELMELNLKKLIAQNFTDSLLKHGWQVDVNNDLSIIISKSLMAANNLLQPGDKIFFSPFGNEIFPAKAFFGYNRFKNKNPFSANDSATRFFLRGHKDAAEVMLAGSFNNWLPDATKMTRTDSGWIADVPLAPGKFWYKFIINGNWTLDNDNLIRENDGTGNTNSVFYSTNYHFVLNGFTNARKVTLAGSFNNWNAGEIRMHKTATGWELPMYLAEGTHTYKFVVDGIWHADPENPEKLPDGNGGYNSVIRFGNPYVFRLNGFQDADQVVVAGSFNNWKENELFMKKAASGEWQLPYVIGPGIYEYKFIVDKKWYPDPSNPLTVGDMGNSFLIIEPNYTFRLKGYEDARSVYVAGDFNGWTPNTFKMKKMNDEWIFPIHLSMGKHRYKFVVDGQWILDPANKLWEQNESGTGNSVIWIGGNNQ